MDSQRDARARAVIAAALAAVLFASILLLWVPDRWAASAFQTAVFVLAAAALWRARELPRAYPLYALTVAPLWAAAQLALGITVYRWDTGNALLTWTAQLACFYLGLETLRDERLRARFLRAVFYFGFALAVIATLQLFTSRGKVYWIFPSGYEELVLGPFVYHNQFAAFVELVLPLGLVAAMRDRRRRLVYAAMTAALYASVIASASRAGSALVTAEVVVILALGSARRQIPARAAALVAASLAGFALCFAAVVGWQNLWTRLQLPDLFSTRRELLWSTLDMIRERPWTGFGLGTWSTAYPRFAYSDDGLFANQAHNDWAQWAAEGGLPFFALLVSIAVWSARPALRSLWGVGILAVFLHSLVDYPTQRAALGGLFFTLLGALAAQVADSTATQKKS